MAVLFLDDEVARHVAFAKRYPGALQVTSVFAAQAELNSTPGHITELWLDYDLGSQMTPASYFDEATGYAVGFVDCNVRPLIDWMTKTDVVDRELPIVIHSWNTPGALWMSSELRKAGFFNVRRAPFSVAVLATERGAA